MKKLIFLLTAVLAASSTFAWHGPHGPCHPWGPPPPPHHWGGGGSWWGRGGRNFWPGFIGGVVGGMVGSAITSPRYYNTTTYVTPTVVSPSPVIVQQPVVVPQPAPVIVQQPAPIVIQQPAPVARQVWVEGRYVDSVSANGSIVRVWQPGHYTTVTGY